MATALWAYDSGSPKALQLSQLPEVAFSGRWCAGQAGGMLTPADTFLNLDHYRALEKDLDQALERQGIGISRFSDMVCLT